MGGDSIPLKDQCNLCLLFEGSGRVAWCLKGLEYRKISKLGKIKRPGVVEKAKKTAQFYVRRKTVQDGSQRKNVSIGVLGCLSGLVNLVTENA